jgi:hypothetical protein
MKLILILLQSVQMKLVYDTKRFEQIMAVQCVDIFPAIVWPNLSLNSEIKVISYQLAVDSKTVQ